MAVHTEPPLAGAALGAAAPFASDAMAQQEQGLLADLDLIELVGKDAGPSAGTVIDRFDWRIHCNVRPVWALGKCV